MVQKRVGSKGGRKNRRECIPEEIGDAMEDHSEEKGEFHRDTEQPVSEMDRDEEQRSQHRVALDGILQTSRMCLQNATFGRFRPVQELAEPSNLLA